MINFSNRKFYRIADLCFGIDGSSKGYYSFNRFKTSRIDMDVLIDVEANSDFIIEPDALPFGNDLYWLKDASKGYLVFKKDSVGRILVQFESDLMFSKIKLKYNPELCDENFAVTGPLGDILFRSRLALEEGFVIHGAAINYNQNGIIFIGPSGAGKSTQAHFWKRTQGASIINGDRPAVRLNNGTTPIVYGSPWCGLSREYKNDHVPIKGIVFLGRSPISTIRELDLNECVARLMPRVFLPYQEAGLMDPLINGIDKIVKSVPAYELSCRKHVETIDLVKSCLML